MKRSTKSFLIAMAALPGLFVACSDPEVSDEVAQLRQTQADLLRERVEAQDLENALKALENARDSAQFAAEIAQANLEVQQAADALENYLRTQGLNEAAELLKEYTATLGEANTVRGQVVLKEAMISDMELLIAAPDPNDGEKFISFALAAEIIQADLDAINAQLASEQAALAVLQNVQADPSAAQAEIAQAQATITDLENQNLALLVALEKANIATNIANDALMDTNDVITDYEDALDNIADTQNSIISQEAQIQAGLFGESQGPNFENAGVSVIEAAVEVLLGDLANQELIVAAAGAARQPFLEAQQDAQDFLNEKAQELDLATANRDIAQVNQDNNPSPENAQALTDAITAYNDAFAARSEAQADLIDANNAFEAAEAIFFDALDTKENIEDDINDLQVLIDVGIDAVNNLQIGLAQLQEELADYEQDVAQLQEAYDAADITALTDAVEAAQDAEAVLSGEFLANQSSISDAQDVIDALENQVDNLNEDITMLEDQIEGTKAEVEALTKLLADNTIDETEWLAEIDRQKEALANLQSEYNALLALAEAQLAAYNDALAAQVL